MKLGKHKARQTRRTTTRSATIVADRAVFDVVASTVRDWAGNERTQYSVHWNGGSASGTFALLSKQVTAVFGQPCATKLMGAMLVALPPVGVGRRDERAVQLRLASTERSAS
jgi:hypothetical protein